MALVKKQDRSCWYYRFRTREGKVICRSTGETDKNKARTVERKARRDVVKLRQQHTARAVIESFATELAGGREIPLADAFDVFEKKPKRKPTGSKQLRSKESMWADFVAFMAARYPAARNLNQVKPDMAEGYITWIRGNGRFDKAVQYCKKGRRKGVAYTRDNTELSPRSCNAAHRTLQQVFSMLQHDAGLLENPFAEIPKLREQSEQREAFTEEELKRIGEKADAFLHPLFAIAISTGLREGDICMLKWSEVDLKASWIKKKMAKTGREVDVPILPPLRAYLQSLASREDGSEYVLPEQANMYRSNPSGISYRVKKFLEGNDVGIATTRKAEGRKRLVSVKDLHSCRHTFCYLAAIHGVPLPIVQGIVGHVDDRITRMYMDHATRKMKAQSLAGMPNYMGLPEPAQEQAQKPEETREEQAVRLLESMTATNRDEWPVLRDQALKLLKTSKDEK